MKHAPVLLVTVTSAAFALVAPVDPVCIIGAGPAGLTIANRLQTKGHNTVIFEKNAEVGGKCQAFYDEHGLFHPLGAFLFSNDTYKETLPIIDASGLPSLPFAYTMKPWLYNWTTGDVNQSPVSASDTFPSLKGEIDRYIQFWNKEFAPNLATIGYKHGIPKKFTVPTSQWLQENSYQLLGTLFMEGMVPYGYGDITQTPIIYMFQYFTPDILLFFAGQHPGYIIDFHQVFLRYAKTQVKGPIHLSTSITKIDRSCRHPVISYRQGASSGIQKCSKLILAFPPVRHALEAANLELSANEKDIFSPIGFTNYFSGAVRVDTPDGFVYTATLPFQAQGEPVGFFRIFNGSDIASTWSWGKYRGNETLEQAKMLLKQTLSRLNKDPRNATAIAKPVTDADVLAFRQSDYFAHYDQPQLEAGYFSKFNALQGQQNTYYASGFNGLETVEFAIRAGKDVVDTYFPH